MPNTLEFTPQKLIAPGTRLFAITPHDTDELAVTTRALYVGASGNVQVTTLGGDTVVLVGLAAGMFHPIQVYKVWSTNTTATSIVGCY